MVREQLDAAQKLQLEYDDTITRLKTEMENVQEAKSRLEGEIAEATAGAGRGRHADALAPQKFAEMKEAVGVRAMYATVPSRKTESADGKKLSQRHMAAVLKGRGEGDDINIVADALHQCGYLQRLPEARRFQPVVKGIVKAAVGELQKHWTARHAVHVWDRLELSRPQMDTLRHLLSFVYDPVADKYTPISVWTNPYDESDIVLTAALASRWPREREYKAIASEMNITVGSNGRCERDTIACTSNLYSNYCMALRSEYSVERPAQPVLYLDGTGSGLGRGICHGEMGCADFIAVGDSDSKQSRSTLQPLFLYEGNDHVS